MKLLLLLYFFVTDKCQEWSRQFSSSSQFTVIVIKLNTVSDSWPVNIYVLAKR